MFTTGCDSLWTIDERFSLLAPLHPSATLSTIPTIPVPVTRGEGIDEISHGNDCPRLSRAAPRVVL